MGEKPMAAFEDEAEKNINYVYTVVPQPSMIPTALPRGPKHTKPVPQPRVLRTPTLPPYSALYGEQFDVARPACFHPGVDAFNAVVAGARICFFVQIVRRAVSRTPTTAMVLCKQEPSFASQFAEQVCVYGKDPQAVFNDSTAKRMKYLATE